MTKHDIIKQHLTSEFEKKNVGFVMIESIVILLAALLPIVSLISVIWCDNWWKYSIVSVVVFFLIRFILGAIRSYKMGKFIAEKLTNKLK